MNTSEKFDLYALSKTLDILVNAVSQITAVRQDYLTKMHIREELIERRIYQIESSMKHAIIDVSEKNLLAVQDLDTDNN